MRIGHGYDAHRFVADKPLVLGGVTVPYEQGLLAHSDGDVVLHALCDALLGAAGLGDIGQHFPDTDNEFKNIDSRLLLRRIVALLTEKGLSLINADMTIIAQAPKLAPFLKDMAINIAADNNVNPELVNIKATTTEGMGFAGRQEGIEVHAVVLLGDA
ncbi:MAG: 2-C-methyl-D-erythritol 2,4-cyclodiphosphate synthase [Piscirickettsiaceae bacterium]|nr:MAG: 2-C-methyl-D-erythritol 2,4-cyclodiphosphate synthase [Piscirickettsiaceae bacterium]